MTTAFNMSLSNTSISLAKKTKIYTFHVILSQRHTCKNIISSYPHNPSSPGPGHLLNSHAQIFHSYLLTFPFISFVILLAVCQYYKKFCFSEEETVMNWPRSQQTDSVKSSEKIPRLSVSKIIRSKWQMADALANRFCPTELVLRRPRGFCDVIRMECKNTRFWLVHLYHVIKILDSDWLHAI